MKERPILFSAPKDGSTTMRPSHAYRLAILTTAIEGASALLEIAGRHWDLLDEPDRERLDQPRALLQGIEQRAHMAWAARGKER